MKRIALMIGAAGALVAGTTAAIALGAGAGGQTILSSSSAGTSTESTPAGKVWLCHHTGSWKHPYHLIHVSADAAAAHRRHGDVAPGAGNSCPGEQPSAATPHGPKAAKGKRTQAPGKSGEHERRGERS
jgi:hypothetical protein